VHCRTKGGSRGRAAAATGLAIDKWRILDAESSSEQKRQHLSLRLEHRTIATTANICVHTLESLHRVATDKIDALVSAKVSVDLTETTKIRPDLVASARIESVQAQSPLVAEAQKGQQNEAFSLGPGRRRKPAVAHAKSIAKQARSTGLPFYAPRTASRFARAFA